MSTVAIIVAIIIVTAILVFVMTNIFFVLNKRIDEMHKSIAGIRSNYKEMNSSFSKRITELEYNARFLGKSDSEFTTEIDNRDMRLNSFLKQFPMFKDNKLYVRDSSDPYIYIGCDDGTILRYNDKIISVHESSINLKTLHASTTGEKRHMQLFDTLELLCNDKNFRSVYPVSEEDNNTLDVVMRDMSVRRYGFNRSYKSDGMTIEFYKYRGVLEDSQNQK